MEHPTTLPKLIVSLLKPELEMGNKEGTCIICSEYSDAGFPAELPKTFTAFERVYAGNIICPYCYYMLRTPDFRRRSWLVTASSFAFLGNKEEILRKLLDPPNEPWMMYVTKTRRKHGWIKLVEKLNYSRDRYTIGYDENLLYINLNELEQVLAEVEELRRLKIPKQEILTGHYSVSSMRKLFSAGVKNEVLNAYYNSHLLDLVLFLVR